MPEKLLPPTFDPAATLVFFLLVFSIVGAFFLFIHLVMGSVIRPDKPDAEKLTIYECGEPTVGSAWIQFDLRFYVVALLFVIFDVEVAFFFPWATVFGTANQLAALPKETRAMPGQEAPPTLISDADKAQRQKLSNQLLPAGLSQDAKMRMGIAYVNKDNVLQAVPIEPEVANKWAMIAFFDILVFFGVLMVGFAYVWRRGDIDWVRAYQHHKEPAIPPEKPLEQKVVA